MLHSKHFFKDVLASLGHTSQTSFFYFLVALTVILVAFLLFPIVVSFIFGIFRMLDSDVLRFTRMLMSIVKFALRGI